jgi:hypothetical protein
LLFALVRIQNQLKIPARFAIEDSAIISEPVPDLLPIRIPQLRWYREMCEHLQISRESGNDAYSEDRRAYTDGYVSWRK